ncbi:hypothetical protein HDU76_008002, partial [Blyttiomyces sp. JEL0837]
ESNQLMTGKTEVLATIDSNVFTVYSAKSFPGLVPFTELSTQFALQGVRLPNRRRRDFIKDGSRSGGYDSADEE